ncbi:hypothetical protein HDV05_004486 [Chytridiales sp. JEL 0842]|nr:hypothetical protein HDV05_004486 [Chytridiales sp. JEL 0842]
MDRPNDVVADDDDQECHNLLTNKKKRSRRSCKISRDNAPNPTPNEKGTVIRKDQDRKWSDFRTWLRDVDFPRNKMTLASFEETGRGIMATKDIEAGEVMIEVPSRYLMTLQTVNDHFSGSLERAGWPISEQGTLALFLCCQRHDQKSYWRPYINIIPESFETVAANLPLELQLCLPYDAQEKIQTQMYKATKDLGDARAFLMSWEGDCQITDLDYLWAWFAVNTRCITLDTKTRRTTSPPKGTPTMFLSPFMDLLNHSFDANIDAFFDTTSQSFKIVTHVPYKRGTQCFIQYGPHDNIFLLCEYGFVIGSGNLSKKDRRRNHYDHVLVDKVVEAFKFSNERPGFRERVVKELKERGMYGDYTLRYDEESYRLMNALRLIACIVAKEDFKTLLRRWNRVLQGDLEMVSTETETLARTCLKHVCEVVGRELSGKLERLHKWEEVNRVGGQRDLRVSMMFNSIHLDAVRFLVGAIVIAVAAVAHEWKTFLSPPTSLMIGTEDNIPKALKLKQVVLVHRHGERSPIYTDVNKYLPKDAWHQCSLKPFIHALHSVLEPEKAPSVPISNPPKIAQIRIIQGDSLDQGLFTETSRKQLTLSDTECLPGQLTDIGKFTMKEEVGKKLRELYVDKLKFLPEHLNADFNHRELYVRSSGYVRTIESAQYVLAGLFPLDKREPGDASDIAIHIKATENMFPGVEKCPKLSQLMDQFEKATAKLTEPLVASLNYRLESKFPLAPTKVVETTGAVPSSFDLGHIHRLYDAMACLKGAGLELPKGVTNTVVEDLQEVVTTQFWDFFASTKEATRLSIGRFLGDLVETMSHSVEGKEGAPKFALFSGHDTTVGPLLGVFGLFKGKLRRYPPFAAHITFEVFEDSTKKYWFKGLDHYVRMKYNGEPVEIPACAKNGSHFVGDPTFCSYNVFMSTMKGFIPKDFDKECRAFV